MTYTTINKQQDSEYNFIKGKKQAVSSGNTTTF